MPRRRIESVQTTTRSLALSGAALTLVVGGAQAAQDGSFDAPPMSITERLDMLERDNQLLREEVRTLRAEDAESWMTEARTAEIRALVGDVLEDSATRTSLQDSGAMAGWSPDRGFYLRSADNRFSLQFSGLLQARYMWSRTSSAGFTNTGDNDPSPRLPNNDYGFDLPHTRLVFQGHVFEPGIRYYLRTQFSPVSVGEVGGSSVNGQSFGALDLLDAYVAFDLDNQWTVRFGQFKLPFARESLISVQNLLSAGRSTVDQLMGIGRSQGIELSTQGNDISWAVAVSDGGQDNLLAGISNNSGYFPVGTNATNTPYDLHQSNFAFTTRLEYKLTGDWSEFSEMTSPIGEASGTLLGLAAHYQMGGQPSDFGFGGTQYAGNAGNNEWITVTGDATFNFGGATFYAAAYYSNTETKWSRSTDPNPPGTPSVAGTTNLMGLLLQGAMYITPKWEVFARYEYIDPITQPRINPYDNSPPVKFSPTSIATLGANWYLDGQDLRLNFQLAYSLNEVTPVSATPNNGFRPMFQATSQFVVSAQFQLQF